MIKLKYPQVFVRYLLYHDREVATNSARIISYCLSFDETIDDAFVAAGIIRTISDLYDKQRLREN